MADVLTSRQEAFCRHYSLGTSAAEAARRAGYAESTARDRAQRLLMHPGVQVRVGELRDGEAQSRAALCSQLLQHTETIRDRAMAADSYGTALRAVEVSLKLVQTLGLPALPSDSHDMVLAAAWRDDGDSREDEIGAGDGLDPLADDVGEDRFLSVPEASPEAPQTHTAAAGQNGMAHGIQRDGDGDGDGDDEDREEEERAETAARRNAAIPFCGRKSNGGESEGGAAAPDTVNAAIWAPQTFPSDTGPSETGPFDTGVGERRSSSVLQNKGTAASAAATNLAQGQAQREQGVGVVALLTTPRAPKEKSRAAPAAPPRPTGSYPVFNGRVAAALRRIVHGPDTIAAPPRAEMAESAL